MQQKIYEIVQKNTNNTNKNTSLWLSVWKTWYEGESIHIALAELDWTEQITWEIVRWGEILPALFFTFVITDNNNIGIFHLKIFHPENSGLNGDSNTDLWDADAAL